MTAAGTAPLPDNTEIHRRVRQGRRHRRRMAASTRRRSIAIIRRSHPFWKSFLRGKTGDVLEIGCGTGQHAVAFAEQRPSIAWWPTDLNDNHLRSIAAWRSHTKLDNVKAPVRLDASAADWRLPALGLPSQFTAIFCANVIHISPWARGGRSVRRRRAPSRAPAAGCSSTARSSATASTPRRATPRSTKAFAAGIRNGACATRPSCGQLATKNGLRFVALVEMPSNNAILTFER